MYFLPEKIDQYTEKHSEKEPELLAELNRETYQKVLQPRMLSGHFQGRILSMLSNIQRPKNILEIGTYTGYSALCLAEGMQKKGQLHTIDKNEELYDLQRTYFNRSPWGKQIIQHTGSALDIIPKLELHFDLVFIDADKSNYLNYFEMILPKMNQGGILLSDNVLWNGKVLEKTKPRDKDTEVLKEYNQKLSQDSRLKSILLPIRDGLTVTRVL